eukprot:CAMPEP_0178918324 /NCGR_PEP_ID=MMETSP0786-20121207/13768_1 /TAXON_ID=186022 /ORGANISM="Thalassionema frauenfeldii, Strain CCMP 1798" /LENGTH=318 /DNA_ID=CAMNT_0020592031 /DNA_START=67 /DNA_END=1023 /DNA_ORIENTATION=-
MKIAGIFLLMLQVMESRAFAPPSKVSYRGSSKVFADGGPPQYDKIDAVLKEVEVLSKGSVMLHIYSETTIDYKPGHVLALEIEADVEKLKSDDEKNNADAIANGGWMRGPYTVSRATDNSLDILIKVVGSKSKMLSEAESGTPLKFGGKFKVPIVEGIQQDDTKRVVFISTGVGVGPCVGAIEEALKDNSFPPVELYASYRNSDEIVYSKYLDDLQTNNPGKFSWQAIVSSETGRLSASEENLEVIAAPEGLGLDDTHYHLIGNGQLVSEFKTGLEKAGVPKDKVTVEMYFNHKAEANNDVIDRIADAVIATNAIPAN